MIGKLLLPGLIDSHVHLRDPGQTNKEDFYTGTSAALAGGFTTILDMPNNKTLITTLSKLNEKIKIARKKIVCDVGFYFGSLGDNSEEFEKVQNKTMGIKIYLNKTTGGFIVTPEIFKKICKSWPKRLPILIHSEEDILKRSLEIANKAKQSIHVCHVSSEKELKIIIAAKKKKYKITCATAPHYLFLTNGLVRKIGAYALIKPFIKTKKDQEFLWKNLKWIDAIESDHAPHTQEEKAQDVPPTGFPGLETTLPLLLTAANAGKITIEEIKRLCHDGPSKIFDIKTSPKTYIEIDVNRKWTINQEKMFTRCKMSPFDGWKMKGKVKRVFIRGHKVFENGKVLAKPGFGKVKTPRTKVRGFFVEESETPYRKPQ